MPDADCPGCCHRRGRIVMVEADRLADASVVLRDEEPKACVQCGVVPQFVVTVILSVLEGPVRAQERLSGNEERP